MAHPYSGQLNQNIINKVLFNMIISQQVFDSKVANTELADMFRVDGSMYGDTKLFHSFDIGAPQEWGNDSEAQNLLELNRNKSGQTQSITMGVYKMIFITLDSYISKQAFQKEGTFAEFIGFMTSSLRKIKRVYDRSLINSKIGTLNPGTYACNINIETPKGATIEETNRLEAQTIAQELVILKAEMEDNGRDYNEYGYLRSYNIDDFIAVWNVRKQSKITKLDLPTIFHKDINAKGGFREFSLTEKWFGNAATEELTLPTNAASNTGDNRILESAWYDVSGDEVAVVSKPNNNSVYLWAGDKVPYTGQEYNDEVRGIRVTVVSTKLPADYYYIVDKDIAFMLVHKSSLPFMSGFETGTQFWNPRSLTNNHYLIWGHNNLEFLKEYPRIKVKVTQAAQQNVKLD